jgi:hypothetical protein
MSFNDFHKTPITSSVFEPARPGFSLGTIVPQYQATCSEVVKSLLHIPIMRPACYLQGLPAVACHVDSSHRSLLTSLLARQWMSDEFLLPLWKGWWS